MMQNPINNSHNTGINMAKDWKPISQKQVDMISATAFEVLCGGARGGTKSESALAWLALPVRDFPEYTALVLRNTYDDLKAWLRRATKFYAPMGGVVSGVPATVKFPNGPVIFTGHLRDQKSVDKALGGNYHRILIEELQLIELEGAYEKVLMSCRSTTPGLKSQFMGNCNPGGAGHMWISKRWRIQGKPPYENKIFVGENGRTRQFVFSTMADNPELMRLDPDYARGMAGMKDKVLARAWLYGDWSVFSGQFFSSFSPMIHGMLPYKIPTVWELWAGMDYGEVNATAFAVYTKDSHTNQVIRLFEYYMAEEDFDRTPTAETHAKGILKAIDEWNATGFAQIDISQIYTYADPSMNTKRRISDYQIAESAWEVFESYGFNLMAANNDRVPGWRTCRQILGYEEGRQPGFKYFLGYNPKFEEYIDRKSVV